MKRELTCIICPIGCNLSVELADGKVIKVSGNTCPRGKKYAESECTAPMRSVATTVLCEDGRLCSVKTDRPIPKEKIFELMEIVNKTVSPLPISAGDVIIRDVFGADIVATRNM